MGVINMAHGEFIMIGAYTGYVVQQFIPNYTVDHRRAAAGLRRAFLAGVAMERLVIRWLYTGRWKRCWRPSASPSRCSRSRNIFGTQARPLTRRLAGDGAWVLNDVSRSAISASRSSFSPLFFLVLCCSFSTARGSGWRCGR
jgi:urea transport system permease protein